MIVVLPVCQKDADASLRNLDWIRKLDGQAPFHCIVSHDTGFDASKVIEAAHLAFTKVTTFTYPPPKRLNWPEPENVAWQRAAVHIYLCHKQPWLWWEQDAVPIQHGWLTKLDADYVQHGAHFMGAMCTINGAHHLTGVAIYPANVPARFPNMMMATKAPFDAVGDVDVLKESRITPLIQVNNTRDVESWQTPEDLERIAPETVLYHRCKDSSLLDLLKRPKQETKRSMVSNLWERITSPPIASQPSKLTVVITNFQRPDFLWSAFDSCLAAGHTNIVVTSSGATSAVEEVHRKIQKRLPSAVIVSERSDSGSNTNWLRGIEATRSEWVQILHDDDRLLSGHRCVLDHLSTADFLCWDAETHGNAVHKFVRPFPGLTPGVHPTTELRPMLLGNRLSPSPVAGCFPRHFLIDTLRQCDSWGPEFYYRGKLLVGNDLLIWLRASVVFNSFSFLGQPLISYGNHPGSATVASLTKGDQKLMQIYNRVRTQFKPE